MSRIPRWRRSRMIIPAQVPRIGVPAAASSRSGSPSPSRAIPSVIVVDSPPGSTSASSPSRSAATRTSTASAPSEPSRRAWASKSPCSASTPTRGPRSDEAGGTSGRSRKYARIRGASGGARRRPRTLDVPEAHLRTNGFAVGARVLAWHPQPHLSVRRYLRERPLVLDAEPVPAVQLEALPGERRTALVGEPGQDRVERLLLADAGLERLLAAEAGGDLQRLTPVLAERGKDVDEELLARQRLAHLERDVPGGEERQVVLVEIGDRLGVVGFELRLGDLVHPGADDLAEDLPACLTAHRVGDDADGVLRFDEAEGHGRAPVTRGIRIRAPQYAPSRTDRPRGPPDTAGRLGRVSGAQTAARLRASSAAARPGASRTTPGSRWMPTDSISARICGCAPRSRIARPPRRSRRASSARSSISETSAKQSSDRSTITSVWARSARARARRRNPCVLRSSSPAQRRTGGVSVKSTMRETYSKSPTSRKGRRPTPRILRPGRASPGGTSWCRRTSQTRD